MKLVSKDAGFCSVTVVADEIRPLDGINLPGLFQAIADRYRFNKSPSLEEARAAGAKFRGGVFVQNDKQIIITELGVFNDGFAATTSDTGDSKQVLFDLLDMARNNFKFRDPTTPPKWFYQSDLVVEFQSSAIEFMEPLIPVIQFLEQEFATATGEKKKFNFDILGFVTEQTPPNRPQPQFYIQRRVGAPLGSKRYFSKAHIPTLPHIRLLEMLDETFTKKVAKKRR